MQPMLGCASPCENVCVSEGLQLLPLQGKVGQVQDANADEEEAAAQAQAVAVALAESVAGSPQARSVCATPPPHTPYASSGGTTPQYDRVRRPRLPHTVPLPSSCG